MNQNGLPGFVIAWQPKLEYFPVTEQQNEANFEWPTLAQVKEFPLTKQIKLRSVYLYGGANLMQIKLKFTNGVESAMMQSKDYVPGYYEYSIPWIDRSKNIKGISLQQNHADYDGMRFEDNE